MIFTQEQINEIKRRLSLLGTKDTEFEKTYDLTGGEQIPIIQDGYNKLLPMQYLLNNYWYANEVAGIQINSLQELLNQYYSTMQNAISFKGDIEVIPAGETRDVGFTFDCINAEGTVMLDIYKDGVQVAHHNATTFPYHFVISNGGTGLYRCEADVNGIKYVGLWDIKESYDFWIGTGADYNEVLSNTSYKHAGASSLSGTYFLNPNENDYIFIICRSNVVPTSVTMSGFDVPFSIAEIITVEGVEYSVYQSANIYQQGSIEIKVNDIQYDTDSYIAHLIEEVLSLKTKAEGIEEEVRTIADEETITVTENNKVALKNRPMKKSATTNEVIQKGYVILRETDDFKTVVESYTEGNVIFEIDYAFDLGGQSVNIPEGCTLKFDGGKISNGTLVGSESISTGNFILDNVVLKGSWTSLEINEDVSIEQSIHLNKKLISDRTIKLATASTLIPNNCCQIRGVTFDCQNNSIIRALTLNGVTNVLIEDCSFVNCGSRTSSATAIRGFINVIDCSYITIRNCKFDGCYANNDGTSYSAFGITIQDSHHIVIDNCSFENINSTGNGDGDAIKVLDDTYSKEAYITVSNCYFNGFSKRALKFQSRYCTSINNRFVVTSHIYAVVDFQAGYGKSIGDSVFLNYDGVSTLPNNRLFENIISITNGYTTIIAFEVEYNNGTIATLQNFIGLTENIVDSTDKNVNDIVVTDCIVNGATELVKVNNGCIVDNIKIKNVVWNSITDGTYYMLYTGNATAIFSNLSFDVDVVRKCANSICPQACSCTNSDFKAKSLQPLIGPFLFNNMAANNTWEIIIKDSTLFESYAVQNGQMTVRQKNNTNPSGKTTSAYALLRVTFENIIVLISSPIVDTTNNKITFGYMCTTAGTSSSSGTYSPIKTDIVLS